MIYHYNFGELFEMLRRFGNGERLIDIAQIFGCSRGLVGDRLFKNFPEEYKKSAKEHRREVARKATEAAAKLPRTEKQLEWSRKACLKNSPFKKGNKLFIGEKNPNWNGGISNKKCFEKLKLSVEEWKILAQEIRKRDNFICQYCGKKNSTSIHHIIPARIKIDNHLDNLITLCRSCHVKVERLTDKYLKKNKAPIEIFYEKWSN